ncbi:LysR substrate-binding domain-containing protein [Hahella sp. SMD15-11]|uniref:LysR substrate-binding domain-containing protein n=1 Tax=Thermohahella caldifontis TaxID=3142973 RepID=A0AB39V1U4_9GAMM
MRYTLRQLQVFVEAARHQNISRAAEVVGLSQSAASSALKELESAYGVRLFDRNGKRLVLNEQGRRVRALAQSVLDQAGALDQTLRQHAEGGPLKVGATLSIGNYLAIRILASMQQERTPLQVGLTVANTREIARQVLDFELDMGMVEGELNEPELEVIPWRPDELVVFCSPSHPFASRPELTDADLRSARWIMREPGSGTRQAFEHAMHGLLPELNIVLELQHTEAIKRAVEANLGISCLSRLTLEDAFARGSLIPLSTPGRDLKRELYFILHRQKYRSPGLEHWMSLCRSVGS